MTNVDQQEVIESPLEVGDHPAATSAPDRGILSVASEAATLLLVAKNDAGIDLVRANGPAHALSSTLRNGFLNTMLPILPSASEECRAALGLLMGRIATLEADLFLIKSSLATEKQFVFGEGDRFIDPLMVLDRLESDIATNGLDLRRPLSVPLGPAVLGSGWHEVEVRGSDQYWRWSGPGCQSTLVLPSPGPGRHCLSADISVLDPRQYSGLSVSVNGRVIERINITPRSPSECNLSLEFDLPADSRSGFFYLGINVPITIRPVDIGKGADERALGLGLSVLSIEPVEEERLLTNN